MAKAEKSWWTRDGILNVACSECRKNKKLHPAGGCSRKSLQAQDRGCIAGALIPGLGLPEVDV